MQTTAQLKAPSTTHTPPTQRRQAAIAAPAVNSIDAPLLDTQQEEGKRSAHSFGTISVFPPDPPIQPKRTTGVVGRLAAFNSPAIEKSNSIPGLPASWTARPPIQAKLTIGQPNDQYEQEADHVAEQVMRMSEPRVQAKCACGGEASVDGECAACQAKRVKVQRHVQAKSQEEDEVVQTKSDDAATDATPDLESRLNGSRGSGQALPDTTRTSMESAFSADFGGVRVHTGNEAVQMNHELSAQAFTHGSDIYFNAGKYEPNSAEGKGLLAHELTHVVQQTICHTSNSLSALQRDNGDQASDQRSAPILFPYIPDFDAQVSPAGGVLSYRLRRHVILQTTPEARTDRVPFAYQYIPAMPMLNRNWPIIRLVVAPGVSIRFEGYPSSYIANDDIPSVEIYRVQDPELVPVQGEFINPSSYGGITPIRSDEASTSLLVAPSPVIVLRRADGIDIMHHESRITFRITAPNLRADARFAYEITLGDWQLRSMSQPTTIRVVKTASVQAVLVGTLGQVFVDPRIELYEVDSISQVPAQGQPIHPIGREIQSIPAVTSWTIEQILAAATVDTAIGAIPIIGDLVDIAEFIYGAVTGRDRWGRRLSDGELALMGAGVLIPIASGSLLRSGRRLARELGQNADHIQRLLRGIDNLSEADVRQIRRWDEVLRSGGHIPTEELQHAQLLLQRLDHVVTTTEAGSTTVRRTLDDLLNAERTGFTHVELQEAYQQYVARNRAVGSAVATPEEWTRLTRGGPHRILESLLGSDFARAARTGEHTTRFVRLTDIPRPASYNPERLTADFHLLSQHHEQVFARLGNLTGSVLSERTINQSLFNILKGNVAEVLAGVRQTDVLTQIRRSHPSAQLMSGIRARLVQADGRLLDALMFTDNIIATRSQGNLYVHAVFEVKSGPRGGAEATSQIHRWIEQHLDDGFEIQLSPDERFRYLPGSTGRGQVIGLANAERHIITPSGTEHLGLGSAEQVAAPTSRYALPQTADEINFLARTVLEGIGF